MFKSRFRREIYMINMDNWCSFNDISLIVCGECRIESGITPLKKCVENIQTMPPFKLPLYQDQTSKSTSSILYKSGSLRSS